MVIMSRSAIYVCHLAGDYTLLLLLLRLGPGSIKLMIIYLPHQRALSVLLRLLVIYLSRQIYIYTHSSPAGRLPDSSSHALILLLITMAVVQSNRSRNERA